MLWSGADRDLAMYSNCLTEGCLRKGKDAKYYYGFANGQRFLFFVNTMLGHMVSFGHVGYFRILVWHWKGDWYHAIVIARSG